MTETQTYEDELSDARGQVQQDLLDALEAASKRLRTANEAQSTVGIREAAEAILRIEDALTRYGNQA